MLKLICIRIAILVKKLKMIFRYRRLLQSDPDLTPSNLTRPQFNAAIFKAPIFFENTKLKFRKVILVGNNCFNFLLF